MLAVTRKNKIKEMVLEKKSVTVSELAALFSLTEETIRRDLKALEDEGVLTRTYGGAFVDVGVQSDIKLSVREGSLVKNKQSMASACRKLISNGDSIFLDHSTTVLPICEIIANMRVTVLTNSLKITTLLQERENIKIILLGGVLSPSSLAFFSPATCRLLQSYYVDKVFMSCRSLHMDFGISDSNEDQAKLHHLAIERSGQVYLLADHTKFDKVSFVQIDQLDKINTLITDKPLPPGWKDYLDNKGIKYIESMA